MATVKKRSTRSTALSQPEDDKRSSARKKKAPNKVVPVDPDSPSPEEMDTSDSLVQDDSSQWAWSHLASLCMKLPGRKTQIEQILMFCGKESVPTPPLLYVYGNTGTGKTLVIKTVLEAIGVPHVVINCVECYSSRVLFESVLSRLCVYTKASREKLKADNMCVFVRSLQEQLCVNGGLGNNTLYLVLDKAERLRDLEVTILPAMMRLKELSGCEVCVLLVTELPFVKLATEATPNSVLTIHFPDYTKAETLAIMSLDRDLEDNVAFYTTFCNHIWNVFNIVCRDLGELRHLSALLYPKYREPVVNEEIGCDEPRRLWKHIEPFFKEVMSRIYLRELSSHQGERALATPTHHPHTTTEYLELPYYSKYLLLSAFLASYNPAKTDKKFFSKTKQSKTKKSKRPAVKEKPNSQLLGPKAFPLDRLMAIFYSILEEEVAPTASLYSQVSSLVSLQLLAQLSSSDSLDSPKYKCLMTLEHIRPVARSVGFDILQYLCDFT